MRKKTAPLEARHWPLFLATIMPSSDAVEDVFSHWEDLVFFLRLPVEAYSGTLAIPAWDMMDIPVLEAEDRKSPAVRFCILWEGPSASGEQLKALGLLSWAARINTHVEGLKPDELLCGGLVTLRRPCVLLNIRGSLDVSSSNHIPDAVMLSTAS